MLPKRLQLENFGFYASVDLDLADITLCAIVGPNGAGKSTILDAMRVALYGRAAGSLDGFVKQGADRFTVIFEFEAGGEDYRVVREHGKAQKATMFRAEGPVKHWVPIAALVDILGCDYASFTLAHHLPQGALGMFASLDPGPRKEWLASNLPLGRYAALEAVARARVAKHTESLTRLEGVITDLESRTDEDSEGLFDRIADEQGQVDIEQTRLLDLEGALSKAQESERAAKTATDARNRAIEAQRAAGEALRASEAKAAESRRIIEAADAIRLLPVLDDDAEIKRLAELDAAAGIARDLAAQIDALKGRISGNDRLQRLAETDVEEAETRKAALAVEEAPVCPTCHQAVKGAAFEDVLVDAQNKADAAYARLNTLVTEAADLHPQLMVLQDKCAAVVVDPEERSKLVAVIGQRKLAREQNAAIARTKAEADGRRDGLAELDERVAALKAEVIAAQDALKAIPEPTPAPDTMTFERQVRETREQITTLQRSIARLEALAERVAKDADRLADLRGDGLDLRGTIASETLLAKAYGKSGIQARLLDGAVAVIEDHANAFLERFTSGLQIEMTTQRDNKTGGKRETLDINVTDASGTRPLERFSGGETTRVNFALAVGLSQFLSASHVGRILSFTIDEPTFLDESGLAELVKCLHLVAESVPFVMLISHTIDPDALPQRIVVRKTAAGSVAEVA